MGRNSILSRKGQHAPNRSTTDNNQRILRRSVELIIHSIQADRIEEIFEGIGELKLLTGWNTSNNKNDRCYQKQHLDTLSRKTGYGEDRYYKGIRPVTPQKNQKNVTTRDVQDLGDDLLQEYLQLGRCYNCGKARCSRTLEGYVEPSLERIIYSRSSYTWMKAIIVNTLTSKDLAINIYYHNCCYNGPHLNPPSSKEITELPRHSDMLSNLTELLGEDFQRQFDGAMPRYYYEFRERAPPAINDNTKPSRSLVEKVVRQNKNWGSKETK